MYSDGIGIINRFNIRSVGLSVVDNNEPTPEVQPPLQRAMVIASFACFFSLLLVYWVARPAAGRLEAGGAEFVVYAILPTSLTFIVLYRSCWHREITGAARTCSLLLLSGVILAGVLAAIGVLLCLVWFCLNATSGGFHP